MLIVFTTVPDPSQGERLAEGLVDGRLAACVQILPAMTSVYFWEGNMQHDSEHLLLIKTDDGMFDKVRDFLVENHPYSVPEIVSVRSEDVSEPYRRWLEGRINS